jgi:serine/threonine-protein kinase
MRGRRSSGGGFSPGGGGNGYVSTGGPRSALQGTIVLGRYRINSQLAQGGMSTVYLARNFEQGGLFAVKVIRADLVRDPTIRERIFNELKAVQRIDHPAVVKIFDIGKIGDDQICLVMEYIHGTPLRRIIQGTPVKFSRVVSIIGAVAEGLRASHAQQIIHRDLKPENVLLPRGDNCLSLVKLIDFGIARIIDAPRITTTQHVMGTPEYISPEQALGSKVDLRADIYSLGVMMYEMLSGTLPFRDTDPDALLHHHIHTPPPVLPCRVTQGNEIPQSICDLVSACLSKDPSNRPSDMGIILEVLSNC